jgi:hypothetical protein
MKVLLKPTAYIFLLVVSFASCRKDIKQTEDPAVRSSKIDNNSHSKHTRDYSSEVATKWMGMQLRIMQTTPLPLALANSYFMGYAGVTLYESVVPGTQHYQSLVGQLTGLSALPSIEKGRNYHWAASANAALAAINRDLYPTTSVANKASIDSLENALNDVYKTEVGDETFQRSVNFGKAIAQAIYEWSLTDGRSNPCPPYVPLGVGYYEFYPGPSIVAAGPCWGSNRLFVPGSLDGSAPVWHPVYSTDPSSAYYLAEKEVYDVSLTLTPTEIASALYYRDNPGFQGGGGHYLSMLLQLLQIEQPSLEKSAIAFAKTGISIADALVGCWQVKYQYNIDRPIRYIREVLGHPGFTPQFATPPHPDFPSGHSTGAGVSEIIFADLFGASYQFTDHAYDYLGMPPQSYTSWADMAQQIGNARVLAGIHTRNACVIARQQGNKVAQNIENKLKFLKDDDENNDDVEN